MYHYTDEDRYTEAFEGRESDCCPLCCQPIEDPTDYYACSSLTGDPMHGGICRDCANAMLRELVTELAVLPAAYINEIAAASDTTYLSVLAADPATPALCALAEALKDRDADELMIIDDMTDGEYLPDLIAVLCKPIATGRAA